MGTSTDRTPLREGVPVSTSARDRCRYRWPFGQSEDGPVSNADPPSQARVGAAVGALTGALLVLAITLTALMAFMSHLHLVF